MRRVQIRKVARLGTGHTPSRSVEAYWDPAECTIPWLTLADVWQLRDGSVSVVHETKEKISPLGLANSAAVRHPAGTVAFSRTASVGFSCILGVDMATSQDFVTWTCGPKLDPRYLLWVLRGERDDILRRTQGSTHKTIYMPDIEQLTIPLPSFDEQRRIVEYLDAETAQIDAVVQRKRTVSELLMELRASVVEEELREALVSASRVRFGYRAHEVDERAGARTELPLLSVSIHHGVVPRSTLTDKEPRAEELDAYKRCAPGDLALNRLRAFQGGVGVVPLEGLVSPDYTVLRPSARADSLFLHYLMRSKWFVGEMTSRLRGIGDPGQGNVRTPRVNWSDLRLIEIPDLSLDDQRSLAGSISARMALLSDATGRLERQLALLHEHRHSLISDAVAVEAAA